MLSQLLECMNDWIQTYDLGESPERHYNTVLYNAETLSGLWLPFFVHFFFQFWKFSPFSAELKLSKKILAMTVYLPIYTFCFTNAIISILPSGYFRALNTCHFFFSFIYLVTDKGLTLKAPITTAAENNFTFIFFLFLFQRIKSWYFRWIIC